MRTPERRVQTLRRECLDWILILGRRNLERVVRNYINPYDSHRSRTERSRSVRRTGSHRR